MRLALLKNRLPFTVLLGRKAIPRADLDAYKLRFIHPGSGESVELQAPLPADCRHFIDQLKEEDGHVAKAI